MADTKGSLLSTVVPVLTDKVVGIDDPAGTAATVTFGLSTLLTLFGANIAVAASQVTSGTFADARIAESNVTQHETAIDHDALLNFVAAEHIDWTADQGATNIHAGNIPDLSATYATAGHTHAYGDLTGTAADVTGFDEAVDDRVAALLVQGANITLTYNDTAGTLTIASTGGVGYTDEQAQDAVGGIFADSAEIDFTYTDATPSITASLKNGSVTIDHLSATGTADNTTYLRGDGVWGTPTGEGGGIANVVEDTSPQLGGNLDLNGFTIGDADAADLTKLSEVTATSTELNHVDGVTSAIQTQLDAKAAASHSHIQSDLTGLTTADSPQFAGINLGHATDTLIARSAAGQITVDGVAVLTASNTATVTGKSIDAAQLTGTVDVARFDDGTGASAATFLRGDGTWATPAGSGDVAKVGTPVAGRMAYWTGNGTLGHEAGFTYDDTTDTLTVSKIVVGGVTFDGTNQLSDPGANLFMGWDDTAGTTVFSTALKFVQTPSTVNEITVAGAATGNSPTISATGSDTNIGLTLAGKGTGNIRAGNFVFDADQTVGAGQDNYVLTYDNASGVIALEAATGGGGSGDMTAAVYDPQSIADDAFDRANHTGEQTINETGQTPAASWPAGSERIFHVDGWANSLIHVASETAGHGGVFGVARSRGTVASPTAVSANDSVGFWQSWVYTGAAFVMVTKYMTEWDGTNGKHRFTTGPSLGGQTDAWTIAHTALTASRDILFSANNTYDVGSDGARAAQVHTQELYIAGAKASAVEVLEYAVSNETTALTTGTAKITFRMPFAATLTAVRASVTTAPTGSTLVVDINEAGTTVLSTKLSIDAGELTSATAATAAVISDAALADDALMTIDIDQIGSTVAGAGLKVKLYVTRT